MDNLLLAACLVTCLHIISVSSFPRQAVVGQAVEDEPKPVPIDNSGKAAAQGFIGGFISSFSMIVVSELGDKTFFIAAIMAMRHARLTVFAGAITALGLMTVISALFGGYVTTLIPKYYTYYISTALFALFGMKMLYDGIQMGEDEGQEELEEVQANLRQREEDVRVSIKNTKNYLYGYTRKIYFLLNCIHFFCCRKTLH